MVVQPLDLHLVNVGAESIPIGPTHGEGRLQPHPGDLLKSIPNVWKSGPGSGMNLEGRLSDPQMSGVVIVEKSSKGIIWRSLRRFCVSLNGSTAIHKLPRYPGFLESNGSFNPSTLVAVVVSCPSHHIRFPEPLTPYFDQECLAPPANHLPRV